MPKFKPLKPVPQPYSAQSPPPAPIPTPTISANEAERLRLAGLKVKLFQVIERAERTGRFEHDIALELKSIANAI